MITKLSNKINILSSDLKVLIIGKIQNDINEILSKYFSIKEYLEITSDSVDILNGTLYEQFDLIIFVPEDEDYTKIPPNAIVILNEINYKSFLNYVNKVYAIAIYPINELEITNKIYGALSILETNSIIKTKEKLINKYKKVTVKHNMTEFLDQNSGTMMFINDDLNETLKKLKELEFSKDILNSISVNLIKLSNVFSSESTLINISIIFKEFAQFLDDLDLESIEPSRYGAFDFLTNIIEDLTMFIDELFIYKIIKDTKLFVDSLKNNIIYFEDKLSGYKKSESDDNLEFF